MISASFRCRRASRSSRKIPGQFKELEYAVKAAYDRDPVFLREDRVLYDGLAPEVLQLRIQYEPLILIFYLLGPLYIKML
jgi:hypothetical protein